MKLIQEGKLQDLELELEEFLAFGHSGKLFKYILTYIFFDCQVNLSIFLRTKWDNVREIIKILSGKARNSY